jgi:hypothetical protein
MNRRLHILLLFLFLFLSCSEKTVKTGDENVSTFQWNISTNESIGDIIDSIEFIPLEAHSESLFKRGDKLIVTDNKFFVFDLLGENQLFVFDNKGKFLYKIGKKGQGPGEHLQIRCFTINENLVYVYDIYKQKILKYNIADGTYVGDSDLPFIAHDMIIADNGDFVFARQRIEGYPAPEEHDCHIIITDKDFNIKYKLFPFKDEDCGVWSQSSYLKSTDEYITFHTMVGDSVVLLNRHVPDSNYLVYRMNFGKKKAPHGIANDYERLKEYTFLASTPEITSKYIIGEYWDGANGTDSYIYNIEKQIAYTNDWDRAHIDKFFFPALFHVGDTIFSLYDKPYYFLWRDDNLTHVLSDNIRKHLDGDNDILIKYILKNRIDDKNVTG